MLAFAARRLLISVGLVWAVASLVFLVIHLIPGDPAELLLSQGGIAPDPVAVEELRDRLGLNLPLWTQYLDYMGGLLRGDFGTSFVFGMPVMELILSRLPATLLLMLGAIFCELVLGLTMDDAEAFADCAGRWGLRPDPDDKSHHIAVCAGRGACASAMIDTKETARQVMADAPALLDGSLAVHVSGCAKGCAHPTAAALTLAGAPTGYGLVVNGAASARPSVYIDEDKLAPALSRLDALVRNEKHAGESARACLTRLGATRIIAAVQQE